MNPEEQLQDRLSRLENGESVDTCAADLPAAEVKLLEVVTALQSMAYVRFVRLWFSDILGFLKSFAITIRELDAALEDGMGFDGSSVAGFARIDESDMVAKPDSSTFRIFPWKANDHVVAVMFCDILQPDGKPYQSDPRWVLKKNLERAHKMGYTFNVGPELELFYFRSSSGKPELLDSGGYFDLTPLDVASDLRKQAVMTLEEMGVQVEYCHHEAAPSQHEIDLKYKDALTMADKHNVLPAGGQGGGSQE